LAQSGHAISQFFLEYPELGKQWNNGYLISLSVKNEYELQKLLHKLQDMHVDVSYFTEPDINNELTSICFLENEDTKRLTKDLKLSLNQY
jgi:hypothetical protein